MHACTASYKSMCEGPRGSRGLRALIQETPQNIITQLTNGSLLNSIALKRLSPWSERVKPLKGYTLARITPWQQIDQATSMYMYTDAFRNDTYNRGTLLCKCLSTHDRTIRYTQATAFLFDLIQFHGLP